MSRFAMIAVTALLLGTSMPAQAQIPGFGLYFGDEETDFFPDRFSCLTDRQIRDEIAARGYTNIALNVPNDKRIEVRATRDGVVYLLDFDFCSNRILDVTQLRRAP